MTTTDYIKKEVFKLVNERIELANKVQEAIINSKNIAIEHMSYEEKSKEIKEKIIEHEKEKSKLFIDYSFNNLSKESFLSKNEDITNKIAALEDEVKELEKAKLVEEKEKNEFLNNFTSNISDEIIYELIKNYIEKIYIHKDNCIKIVWKYIDGYEKPLI